MSFVDTYQVGSLRWRRDLQVDDQEEEPAGFTSMDATFSASAISSRNEASSDHVDFRDLPRLELTQAVLAVCLNLGNAQSNKAKTEEGFFDPATRHHERAMQKIMANLAAQLNSIREMTVIALPDPRQETVIAALQRARRASPTGQILFLYNDHGTLAPTSQGEIWVYDTDFPVTPTTYNPIFVSSLMDCTKAGTVYIWDCDNAGRVVDCALEHGKRKDLENRQRSAHLPQSIPSQLTHGAHDIHFGACATDQVLPVLDDLPRDVFTSCMTKPLQMAIRFHSLADTLGLGPLKYKAKPDQPGSQRQIQDDIPGEIDSRDTPLGELNWLFTVIVDTIAWQSLPLEAFRTLFRTNNATRSLSRGYILVQRILRNYDCTPVCYPDIPSTHLHPLWQVWDTALEDFLCQLPITVPSKGEFYAYRSPILFEELLQSMAAQLTLFANPDMNETDCKTASRLCANALPIVFSACTGGRYRQWALNLLARYLDIGGPAPIEWAVNCGIFDILPRVLQWTSTHEASVAVFLLQRLTSHENGIHTLITPHEILNKPPINMLGDFIQQHISTESLNLPADTLAGILYLFTKAVESIGCAINDDFQKQWNYILGVVVDAEDSFVRLWAVLALASCPLNSVKEETVIRYLALTDEAETIRTAAAYAIWCWQGSVITSLHHPATDVEAELITFIAQIAEDASFSVRTIALSLAMELAHIHRDRIVEYVKQHSKACSDRDTRTSPSDSTYDNLVLIMAKALTDPLLFLREAAVASLEVLRVSQNICTREEWLEVFPYGLSDGDLPSQNSAEHSTSDTLALQKPSHTASGVSPLVTKSAHPRFLASRILAWRDRQELYFQQTRLTWADSKSMNEETEVSKNKLRSEQIMAYENGNRAMRSWTKHALEIPTKHKTQLLSFHAQAPVIAYDFPQGYHLIDYNKRSTVAKRTLPIREQGIAALYFVDQASSGLDVIELSRQGIVRVVRDIETPVEDDGNIVRGFRLHDAVEQVRFHAAWNAAKLELHVAVSSDGNGFQIWDLGASRRKAYVATEFLDGISCMDVERQRGNLNLTGFLDGTVALFDTRQQARRGVCRWLKGHKDAILCTSLTASQEIVSMGKDGALHVWDIRVPSQSICTTMPPDSQPKQGIAAAAMGSSSVFAQLLQPVDSLPEVELSIHKLAFPAPAEIANITLSSSAFTDLTACMTFHPKAALLAIAERNKIVIRTANGGR